MEGFEDVCLHVVRVELRLALLVLLELRAHVLGDLLLFDLHLLDDGVVVLLLVGVLLFDISHLLAESAQFLDSRRQLRLLLLHFLLDLLHQLGQFLQRMALVFIELLFQLRYALNLVLNGGVASDALLLLELLEELVDVAGAALQDLLGALQHLHLSLELFQALLALLVLGILLLQICRVLPEVVSLQVLAALDFFVVVLFLLELFLERDLLGLKALDLLQLLVLLLLSGLGLAAVDRQLVVGLLGLNLALKHLALALKFIFIRRQTLKPSLSGLRFVEDHFNALEPIFFVGELTTNHIVEVLTVLSGLIAQVVEHLLGAQVLTSNFLGVHESLSGGEQLVLAHLNHLGQFALFLVQTSVLLLLLSQLTSGVE